VVLKKAGVSGVMFSVMVVLSADKAAFDPGMLMLSISETFRI
jgi:hypothetical protein